METSPITLCRAELFNGGQPEVAEQLLASGAKVIVGLTSAGRISPQLSIPSLVIGTAAVRDEGTSNHYSHRQGRSRHLLV